MIGFVEIRLLSTEDEKLSGSTKGIRFVAIRGN
jgi:hypothetical protein